MFRLSHAPFVSFLSIVLTILIIGQPFYPSLTLAEDHDKVTVPDSSVEKPGEQGIKAHTNHVILGSARPDVAGSIPSGENPGSLACVYNLVNLVNPALNPGCLTNPSSATSINPAVGSGAIAIVDSYDYPTAAADLNTFSAKFGLPTVSSPNFQVVYANGTQPSSDCGWNQEAALDIEWAHAMAPGATIYLVEAASNSLSDLLAAVDKATALVQGAGGGQVSMSWGSGEFRRESLYDSHFNPPTDAAPVAYFAAAGDTGGRTIWPGVSPNVISAGGTRVNRDSSGNFTSESAWSNEACSGGPCGGGGGPSRYEHRPAYQYPVQSIVGSSRGTPDFSFDADPYTGVAV